MAQFLASIYVDDLISRNGTVPEAFQFYLKAKERLLEAGFNLRKFLSDSPELMKLINEREGTVIEQGSLVDGSLTLEEQSYTKSSLNCAEKIEEKLESKVLGVVWNHCNDEICFKLDRILDIANDAPLTKRGILSVISRIYDPLGLMAPAMVEFKFIFSRLCKGKYSWDSPLTDEIKARYSKWLSGLKATSCMNIPQCYSRSDYEKADSIELHTFSNASFQSFAGTIYLRIVRGETIEIVLVMAKNRVAPLEDHSLSRLELLGAVITARLISAVQDAFKTIY